MKNALTRLRRHQELISLAIQVIEWNNIVHGDDFVVTRENINSQFGLVTEESNEFKLAKSRNDIIEQYDAIADIFVTEYYLNFLYQITSYGHTNNINRETNRYLNQFINKHRRFNLDCIIDCIKEVMRSNWTKFTNYQLDSDEYKVTKRGGLWLLLDDNGKVRKPDCYEKPNLRPILIKHGVIKE